MLLPLPFITSAIVVATSKTASYSAGYTGGAIGAKLKNDKQTVTISSSLWISEGSNIFAIGY